MTDSVSLRFIHLVRAHDGGGGRAKACPCVQGEKGGVDTSKNLRKMSLLHAFCNIFICLVTTFITVL